MLSFRSRAITDPQAAGRAAGTPSAGGAPVTVERRGTRLDKKEHLGMRILSLELTEGCQVPEFEVPRRGRVHGNHHTQSRDHSHTVTIHAKQGDSGGKY